MSKYNEKYKIKFNINPIFQCILGQFFGWAIVLETYLSSRDYKDSDEVDFTYYKFSDFNKCFKYIDSKLNKGV